MQQAKYHIREAAQKIDVESHVLRYWEEELELTIKRNEQGYRYYTESDVENFQYIKNLKKQGYQLKAIKKLLSEKGTTFENDSPKQKINILESGINEEGHPEFSIISRAGKDEKALRLQKLLKQLITEAVREHDEQLCHDIRETVIKEMDYQFRVQEEEHFKHLDELLRLKMDEKKKRKRWRLS